MMIREPNRLKSKSQVYENKSGKFETYTDPYNLLNNIKTDDNINDIRIPPLDIKFNMLSNKIEKSITACIEKWGKCMVHMTKNHYIYESSEQLKNKKNALSFTNDFYMKQKKTSIQKASELFKEIMALDIDTKTVEKTIKLLSKNTKKFISISKKYDKNLTTEELFQASRNMWVMTLLQLHFKKPDFLNMGIVSYCLLYPYTDNYIDSNTKTKIEKKNFCEKFKDRIKGEKVFAENIFEQRIFELMSYIEKDYKRSKESAIYKSLIEIHKSQMESMKFNCSFTNNNVTELMENDILRNTISKSGTTLLTDGLMVLGNFNENTSNFLFQIGFITQMLDDFQDALDDAKNEQVTLISKKVLLNESIDNFIGRFMCFIENIGDSDYLNIFKKTVYILLFEACHKLKSYISTGMFHKLERLCPVNIEHLKYANIEKFVFEYLQSN